MFLVCQAPEILYQRRKLGQKIAGIAAFEDLTLNFNEINYEQKFIVLRGTWMNQNKKC